MVCRVALVGHPLPYSRKSRCLVTKLHPVMCVQGGQGLQQGFSMPVTVPVNSSSSSSYQAEQAHSPRPPSSSLLELQQATSYPPSVSPQQQPPSPKRSLANAGASPPRNSLRVVIPSSSAGMSEPELSVVSFYNFIFTS